MIDDIPIIVINLDRAPDRLVHVEVEMRRQGLSYRRLRAVDGRALSDTEIAQSFDAGRSRRTYHVPMQKGEIACFLSHVQAWRTFLDESTAPFAVIMEDDFEFHGALAPVVEALRSTELSPWDMIKLWGQDRRMVRDIAPLAGEFRLVREAFISRRTVGQIVSRAGAEKLLARTLPLHRPIDTQLQYPWETGLEILSVQPSLVIDVGETKLGVSSTRGKVEGFDGAKLRREVRRALLRADRTVRSLAYFATRRDTPIAVSKA